MPKMVYKVALWFRLFTYVANLIIWGMFIGSFVKSQSIIFWIPFVGIGFYFIYFNKFSKVIVDSETVSYFDGRKKYEMAISEIRYVAILHVPRGPKMVELISYNNSKIKFTSIFERSSELLELLKGFSKDDDYPKRFAEY